MDLPARDVEAALTLKGFKRNNKSDHVRFEFPDSLVTTKISHGKGEDLHEPLIRKMASQTHLTRADFLRLVQCPMSAEDYKAILTTKGLIKLPSVTPPQQKPARGKKRKK